MQPFHGLSYPFSAELALRIARYCKVYWILRLVLVSAVLTVVFCTRHHAALQSPMHDRGFYRRAATELGSSGVLRIGYEHSI